MGFGLVSVAKRPSSVGWLRFGSAMLVIQRDDSTHNHRFETDSKTAETPFNQKPTIKCDLV